MKNYASDFEWTSYYKNISVNKAIKFSLFRVLHIIKGTAFKKPFMDTVRFHPGSLLEMEILFPQMMEILLVDT